jgi:hypothetical protein
MPDLCETYLTIEGLNYEVENVIEFLSKLSLFLRQYG